MHKEVKAIARKLEEQGWRIEERKRGHALAYSPDGVSIVPLPGTPSGGRWRENLIAQLRRGGFDPNA